MGAGRLSKWGSLALTLLAIGGFSSGASAQSWPDKPFGSGVESPEDATRLFTDLNAIDLRWTGRSEVVYRIGAIEVSKASARSGNRYFYSDWVMNNPSDVNYCYRMQGYIGWVDTGG